MTLKTGEVPLVLLSGGLDSTLVLVRALSEYACVDVCTVSLTGQDKKAERETKAAKAIIAAATKVQKTNGATFGTIRTISETTAPGLRQSNTPGFGQAPMWMAAAYNCVRPDTADLRVGYLNTDHQAPLIQDTRRAWDAMLDSSGYNLMGIKKPNLFAPFIFMSKEQIVVESGDRLLAPFMKHVTWCESHSDENDCGNCPSCITMLKTINTIKTFEPHRYTQLPFKGRYVSMMAKRKKKILEQKPQTKIHVIKKDDLK